MTDAEHLAQMHPWLRARVEAALANWRASAVPGEAIKLVESVRPLGVQQTYHAQGRSNADGVTEYSLHQFAPACAADVAVTRGGTYVGSASDLAWQRWGKVAEAEGLEWGGRWRRLVDCPHVQIPEVQRIRIVQLAAGATVDGAWGPGTEAAIKGVCGGMEFRAGRHGFARLTLPMWAKLVQA